MSDDTKPTAPATATNQIADLVRDALTAQIALNHAMMNAWFGRPDPDRDERPSEAAHHPEWIAE